MAKRKKKQFRNNIPKRFQLPQPSDIQNATAPQLSEGLEHLLYKWLFKHYQITSKEMITQKAQMLMAKHGRIMETYHTRLLSKHLYPNRQEIDHIDCIDMSSLGNPKEPFAIPNLQVNPTMDLMYKWHKSHTDQMFYHIIPCFKTGFLKINQYRGIYFKILDFDEEKQSIKLHLHDYLLNATNGEHEPGRATDVTYQQIKDQTSFEVSNIFSFTDMYTYLSPRELQWNMEDIQFWEEVILQNAVNQDALFEKIHKNPAKELAQLFLLHILLSNYYLAQKRPVIDAKQEKEVKKKTPIKTNIRPINTDELIKRIRHIGTIRFVSAKTPPKPDQNRIRTYRLENWGVRGHVRHYKNGKTVYIQPQTRHRKSLDGHTNQKVQNILKVHTSQKGENNHG